MVLRDADDSDRISPNRQLVSAFYRNNKGAIGRVAILGRLLLIKPSAAMVCLKSSAGKWADHLGLIEGDLRFRAALASTSLCSLWTTDHLVPVVVPQHRGAARCLHPTSAVDIKFCVHEWWKLLPESLRIVGCQRYRSGFVGISARGMQGPQTVKPRCDFER